MSKETSGPAFPTNSTHHDGYYGGLGMTLRDYFAAKAMQGFLSREDVFNFEMYKQDPWRVAAWSYEAADAMIAERNKDDN